MGTTRVFGALAVIGALSVATTLSAQTYPTGSDPRNGLKAGRSDFGEAAHGMKLLSLTPKAVEFDSTDLLLKSDMAFKGNFIYQGNFSGFSIWDVTDASKPVHQSTVQCATSQGDPSIYGNLLFMSAEGAGNRNDCGKGGVQHPKDHMAGVRIFRRVQPARAEARQERADLQGSHTHTIVPHETDKDVIYIYVSGNQGARPAPELTGCKSGDDPADHDELHLRLDVIKVPLKNPAEPRSSPARASSPTWPGPASVARALVPAAGDAVGAIPAAAARRRPAPARATATTSPPTQPRGCSPARAGATATAGGHLQPGKAGPPGRAADTNFSLWHTAVFSNDGKKVVFTDEWGGGTSPMCQASRLMEMGGNTMLTIGGQEAQAGHSSSRFPPAQTAQENCVSHNGGLIPVPGATSWCRVGTRAA